jgi:hypothetical protein
MECGSHFMHLRQSVLGYKISNRFEKELDNYQEVVGKIMSCDAACFTELHKFEEKIGEISVFRAKMDRVHIVYAIDKTGNAYFLRAFRNFSMYGRFLGDKKGIVKLIGSMK